MKKVLCATYEGFDAKVVDVESTLTKGLPSFSIVGMASTSITESKERVKSALLSNEFAFPPKRITLSLSPSDLKKEGSHFDLSIALMIALNEEDGDFSTWFVFGELGLDGKVKETRLLFPLILSLAKQNVLDKVIVPQESLEKLLKIPNINFFGVKSLNEAIEILKNQDEIQPITSKTSLNFASISLENTLYYFTQQYHKDFLDVKGQEVAKRAALISASGFHNLLLEGSPGCGKSMIAQRLQYILPPLDEYEVLDRAKLDVLEFKEPSFQPLRGMRAPHHSATLASIFGGGSSKAQIGEVGLAHGGILFFDELPHFNKNVLEALREPMQDNRIRISRVNAKVEYPADFMFIGAMNPCPCGNLLHEHLECRCSDLEIQRYKNRLSDPFLDRIDLYVTMQSVKASDSSSLSSKEMHKQVIDVFRRVKQRKQTCFNAKLNDADVEKFCILDDEANDTLQIAIERFHLSFRAIVKVKKVARTIADLDGKNTILKQHILEALSYRKR